MCMCAARICGSRCCSSHSHIQARPWPVTACWCIWRSNKNWVEILHCKYHLTTHYLHHHHQTKKKVIYITLPSLKSKGNDPLFRKRSRSFEVVNVSIFFNEIWWKVPTIALLYMYMYKKKSKSYVARIWIPGTQCSTYDMTKLSQKKKLEK